MEKSVLFKNARLVDVIEGRARAGVSILVEGARIRAVGTGPVPLRPDTQVIDLNGKTVVPGLIDTHVHATLIDRKYLRLFVAAGVTAARDTAGDLNQLLRLKEDLLSGEELGPRLFICGPGLDGVEPSFPRDSPHASMFDSIASLAEVPQKIDGLLNAGVDAVKLYFTLPPDTAKAVIHHVDKRVPVTAHLGYTNSLDVIRAGIDGLEHMLISPYNEFCSLNMRFGAGASMMDPAFWKRLIKGWEEADLRGDLAQTWFDNMVERQVNMGTTLDLLWIAKCGTEMATRDPDRRYITPASLASQHAMAAHSGYGPDWDIRPGLFEPATGGIALEKHQIAARMLHEAGGLLVGGTDCGALSYPPPGFALLREIELLEEAIGAMGAIQSVTAVAARYLRQETNIGSVSPGCYADFIVVDGDPLRDTRELRKAVTVYQGGVAHDPAALLSEVARSDLSFTH